MCGLRCEQSRIPQPIRRPRGAGMRSEVGKHVHCGLGSWGRWCTYALAAGAPAAATGMGAVVVGTTTLPAMPASLGSVGVGLGLGHRPQPDRQLNGAVGLHPRPNWSR